MSGGQTDDFGWRNLQMWRFRALMLLVVIVMAASTSFAAAQAYPSKQIRIIVPAAAGGATDLLARLIGNYINARTNQTVIVENRSGGAGNLGTDMVAKAAPDGYTLGVVGSNQVVINPFIFKNMPFNAKTDIMPVASIAEAPQAIIINTAVPATNLAEFIAYAKARPNELTYASPGVGTTSHLGTEEFLRLAGIKMVHIPYRGATPAVTDLIANHVQLLSVSALPVMNFVKEGRLRVLVAASGTRIPHFPDVPSAIEVGMPTYQMSTWFGLIAPSKVPSAIVKQLNGYVNDMLNDPDVRKRLADSYLDVVASTHEEFAAFVRSEFVKWEKVVRESRIEPQ